MSLRRRSTASFGASLAVLCAAASFAAFVLAAGPGVPLARVPFTGKIVEDGAALTATVPMTFHLYDDASPLASTLSYSETHLAVPVVAGIFTVDIGSITPLPAAALEARELFVSLEVAGRSLEGLIPVDAALHARGAARARAPVVRLDLSVGEDAAIGGGLFVAGSLLGDGDATLGPGRVEVGDGPINNEAGDVAFDIGERGEVTVRRGAATPFNLTHDGTDQPLTRVGSDLAVSRDLAVAGTLHAGLRQVTCPYPSGASHGDCSCGEGEIAVGGGAYVAAVGGGVQKLGLRESRPLDLRTWRVACSFCTYIDYGGIIPNLDTCAVANCSDIYVVCARLGS